MNLLFKQFCGFFSIGVINTLIHWSIFFILHNGFEMPQSLSNLSAFVVAVIFSFFMNSKYTFAQKATAKRFFSFTVFMGVLSYLIGFTADKVHFPVLFTLVFFSTASLFFGFLYSKYIVFRS